MSFDIPFEVPGSWEVKTVEQLIEDGIIEKPLDGNHGGIHPKSSDYVSEGIPFIMASDLDAGRVDLSGCKFITEKQANTLRKGFAKAGDVLISHKATIGRTAIVQDNDYPYIMLTPQVTYYRVIDSLKLSNVYLKAYFDSPFFQSLMALWAGSGSTRAYLGITGQLKLPVIIPPIDDQDFIANHVFTLNEKMEINTQTNQTLEQIAQTLFKSWFVDFDPVKAKISALVAGGTAIDAELAAMGMIAAKSPEQLAELKQSKPDAYKQLAQTAALFPSAMQESELGDIPEGWKITTVRDVAAIIKGKSYKSAELEQSKTALVTLKSFNRGGGYRLDGLKEYTGKYKPEQEVFPGDLVIAYTDVAQAADVIGKPAMVISDARYEHLVISLDVAVIRPLNDNLKYYLYGMAKTDEFQQHMQAHSTGTTVLHLSKNAVPDYKFILANEDLIKAYVKHAKPIFSQINETIEGNNLLSALRESSLPKLLSGELSHTENTTPEAEVC